MSVDIQNLSEQTRNAQPIPAERRIDLPAALELPCNHTFMESLILAQDERWRRA